MRTALEVADALGPRLWGVRLDTSNTLVDRSLWSQMGRFDPRGVNPQLVRNVRRRARRGRRRPRPDRRLRRLHASTRSRAFEAQAVPVDAYGVGSALIRGENDYTADVVRCDGAPVAKVGRGEKPNPRLERVE